MSDSYKQDTKLGFVIDSIYTLAHGLHNMHQDVCDGVPGLCAEMATINGSLLLEYLMAVNFTGVSGHMIHFDEYGDPPARQVAKGAAIIHLDQSVILLAGVHQSVASFSTR